MRVLTVATLLLLGLSACSQSPGRSSTAASTPPAYSATTASGYSGSSMPPSSDAQVRQNLQRRGYTNVSNVHQLGNGDWAGSALNSRGQPVDFDADSTGVIIITVQ